MDNFGPRFAAIDINLEDVEGSDKKSMKSAEAKKNFR